jgi:acyl transferase domain-containing protein/acyl carrier protein/alpha/beta superfamily hydrolase
MIVLPPVTFLQRPLRWLQAITRYGITTSGGPNFAYEMCLNSITPEQKADLDLSSWQLAFSGAEPIRAETLAKFAAYFADCGFRPEAFYPCYGMAETTLIISGATLANAPIIKTISASALAKNEIVVTDKNSKDSQQLVSSGKVAPDSTVAIVNPETKQECQENQVGEIWVAGPSIAQGYWQKEQLTQATFSAYTRDTQAGPFLRTGDLGFLSDGELFVTGRLKDLIIIRGRNHYPQDIELSVGNSHPALNPDSGAAFAVDARGEEQLVVVFEVKRTYLRKINKDDRLKKEIFKAIRETIVLNHELQVYSIALLKTGSIPKTSSGKITRHACKQDFLDGNLDIAAQWDVEIRTPVRASHGHTPMLLNSQESLNPLLPNNDRQLMTIQNWLRQNIAQRMELSPEDIELTQPFVNYGLDSVQAVRLTAELEDWLGCKLAPTLAYDYPNLESLAAYLAQQETKIEVSAPRRKTTANKKIAMVGMACRFPNASNCEEYWQLLREGKDAISQTSGRKNLNYPGGYIQDYDQFDPQFFEISAREAINMDPQQRLLLEVSWEALENANLANESLPGSLTGVFVGISSSDYAQVQIKHNWGVNVYTGTGNALSIAANRISYSFNLTGPSLSVDTACSSSLVALHLAINSLNNGECDQAIVGGVNLILSPELTATFQKAGMMASDGKCKTFDASADGYVRGEGCGVVILKPLDDAIADGHRILAVIHGSAINQDGRSNGLTAPSGKAQQRVIQTAWQNAGVKSAEINYLEAHGTGTALGDPIEINSLAELFSHQEGSGPCWVGSAKTNLGHLEAAAGMAGLIKTVLALQHQTIPASLHCRQLNPYINLDRSRLQIATQPIPWPTSSQPRFAGISSFGFGGSNAHVVIGEYKGLQVSQPVDNPERNPHILTLSAKHEVALRQLIQRYQSYLNNNPELNLADVCFTSNLGRSHFNYRLALVAKDRQELQAKLTSSQLQITLENRKITDHKIAFLFSGQGSQYSSMGRELYQTSTRFKKAIDRCEEILQPYLELPLTKVIFQPENQDLLHQTIYTQPAIFALEYALAQLWLAWGIQPSVVMGHSVGEYVAATLAGVFSLEEGLKLMAHRAKLMQELPLDGAMVCLFTNWETVNQLIESYQNKVAIAAINGDKNIVISGDKLAVADIVKTAKKQRIKTKQLKVSHGFHSPLMKPMLSKFAEIAQEVTYNQPTLEVISNVTGKSNNQEIASPEYWGAHVIKPVKFAPSIEYLHEQNYQIFLEIGAKPTLLAMARAELETSTNSSEFVWLPSLRKDKQDWQQILTSLATLYNLGFKINWDNFHQDYPQLKQVKLPNYPWQNKRYWLGEIGSEIAPQSDLVYHIQWQLTELNGPLKSRETQQDKWLIFADAEGLAEKLAEKLSYSGHEFCLVYQGQQYSKQENLYWINPSNKEDYWQLWQAINIEVDKIVYLWSSEGVKEREKLDLETTQCLGCLPILYLLQTLISTTNLAKLWLVTRASQGVKNQETINPQSASLWGMGKVIAIEHPEYWGGIIDLDLDANSSAIELLWSTINYVEREDQIAVRDGYTYIPRLRKQNSSKDGNLESNREIRISAEGSYLITGGLGALGLKTAAWLIDKGALNLVLVARSQPSASVAAQIQTWRQQGVKILVATADVSHLEQLEQVFLQIASSMPPLKGIIHAAGVLEDGILARLSPASFLKVMKPKVQGAWNLHQLSQHLSLDSFIMFSSIASVLGSPGQGNYAAANACLDALAHYRLSLGLPALSVNWGAFNTGMAGNGPIAGGAVENLDADASLGLLEELINSPNPQVGIMKINWQQLERQFPAVANSPYLEDLLRSHQSWAPENLSSGLSFRAVSQTMAGNRIREQLLAANSEEREELLSSYLQSILAQILHRQPEQLKSADSLIDLGMDSLMVMEAINQLKTDLQLMLYPREFYERPRLEVLTKYIATEFGQTHDSEVNGDAPLPPLSKAGQYPAMAVWADFPNHLPRSDSVRLETPMAFILSSPRAGSTLLRVMLAGHPALVSPPELHLLPFATMKERNSSLQDSYLGEGLVRAIMELKGIDVQASQAMVADLVAQDRPIVEVYAWLQELAGHRLLVDKSPTYAMSASTLTQAEAIFSSAKYIHLVRHPYATIESFARMRMDKLLGVEEGNPYYLAEKTWTQSNHNILQFFAQIEPDKIHQVKYEDLVTQPRRVMEGLCQFLAIPFDESVLTPYQGERMTDGIYRQSMSVGDPNFNSRTSIEANLGHSWQQIKLPIELEPLTCQVAQSLHYPLPHHQQKASLNLEMREEYLNVRGLNLCLCRWGAKDAPLILLLHGILEQGAAWEQVALPLVKKGYQVVAPDLRGHGKSAHLGIGGSYNLLDFVSDLDAIASHLSDKPFTLGGHSLGSVITGVFASIRPEKVKNLVLVEPVLPVEVKETDDVEQLTSHLDYLTSTPQHPIFPDVETVAKRLQAATPQLSSSFALKLARRTTKSCEGGVTFTYSPLLLTRVGVGFNSISRNRYLSILRQIKAPITLVYGEQSNFNRPEDLTAQQEAMTQAKIITLPGGHNLHLEIPTQLGVTLQE